MHRLLQAVVLSLGTALAVPNSAFAADPYPSHPIKIIVNTAPGGFTDLMSRLAAQYMGEYLKQSVVVENRAGGDGMIAIRAVKASPADGYTLAAATGTAAQQMALRLDPGYDLVKDFTGIGIVARSPYIMVVGSGSPDKTVAEFLARAKASPGKLTFASAGVGTVPHFATERFLQQMGITVTHIPYKGNAPALPDVVSGRVDMIFDTYGSSVGLVKNGQFRVLGVTSTGPVTVLPGVKTLAEQGAPGYSYYTWAALWAPAGTPPEVVQRLADALNYAKSRPEYKDRLRSEGIESDEMTPAQFNQFMVKEVAQNQKIVEDLRLEKM